MNQVAEKKNNALATFDMEADAAKGAQNISQEDLALPFLKILGQLSPEVNKRDGKYVDGAEPGKIINTVTNELYDTIQVIPAHYKRQYIEWQDRGTSTGAPVAIHDADSDIVSQTTRGKDYKDRLPNGFRVPAPPRTTIVRFQDCTSIPICIDAQNTGEPCAHLHGADQCVSRGAGHSKDQYFSLAYVSDKESQAVVFW